jgi:hypothetical protein
MVLTLLSGRVSKYARATDRYHFMVFSSFMGKLSSVKPLKTPKLFHRKGLESAIERAPLPLDVHK